MKVNGAAVDLEAEDESWSLVNQGIKTEEAVGESPLKVPKVYHQESLGPYLRKGLAATAVKLEEQEVDKSWLVPNFEQKGAEGLATAHKDVVAAYDVVRNRHLTSPDPTAASEQLDHKSGSFEVQGMGNPFALFDPEAQEAFFRRSFARGSAPQRFESEARPLACVAVMPARFLQERCSKKEGQQMQNNMSWISSKALLLVGDLADAMNEGLHLMGCLDQARLDSEKLYSQVQEFQRILEALFGANGAAWSASRCRGLLISHVYECLEQPRVLDMPRSRRVIGGVCFATDSADLQWVKSEVGSWIAAVLSGLKAEFPSWETSQNFAAFNVEQEFAKAVDWSKMIKCVKRLSRQFKVDEDEAVTQFKTAWPLAVRFRQAAVDQRTGHSWKMAIESLESRHRRGSAAGFKDLRALRLLVARWQSLTFSTCGVEHLFSQSERLFPARRSKLCVSKRRSELALIFGQMPMDALAVRAAEVWKEVYPASPQRLLVRSDKGLKPGPRKDHVSWASIHQKRRRAVGRILRKHAPNGSVQFEANTHGAKAEIQLQEHQLAAKTLEAKTSGHLLEKDLKDPSIKRSLKLVRRTLSKQKAVSNAPKTIKLKAPSRPEATPLAHGPLRGAALKRARPPCARFYVDASANRLDRRLLVVGLEETQDVLQSDLVVCATGSKASTRAQIACWLTGP
ncbi:DNA (cytosine-5-)-methyltransferase [Durusdinium trenchii]|uniref:DNA (Cytosine-5-)-methyltransferase n=1 Tax=Durusdinium trenchii TaxID=1381693 RepID=A0ABP0KT62_9DINO